MRRLPPQQIEKNLSDLIDLVGAVSVWFRWGRGLLTGRFCALFSMQNSHHTRNLLPLQPDIFTGLRDSLQTGRTGLSPGGFNFSSTCVNKAQNRSSEVDCNLSPFPAAPFSVSRRSPLGTEKRRPHTSSRRVKCRRGCQALFLSASLWKVL